MTHQDSFEKLSKSDRRFVCVANKCSNTSSPASTGTCAHKTQIYAHSSPRISSNNLSIVCESINSNCSIYTESNVVQISL